MMADEQLAEVILNHALEIICLLTVEDFIVVKRPRDGTRCTFSIRGPEVNRDICDGPSRCPELLFTLLGMGDKTPKMIAELASKIVRLLTREIPLKREDVGKRFPKDEGRSLEGRGARYKDSRAVAQPTAPAQRSTEKSFPIVCRIKEEPEEEARHTAGGMSALPMAKFIPGNPEGKSVLPTVNIYIPLDETASGIGFVSSCDIKCDPGGDSSDDTIDSADAESPQYPSSPVREHIKEEPEESQDSNLSVCVEPISPENSSYKDEDCLPPKTNDQSAGSRESGSGQTLPPCEVCGTVFSSQSALEKHLQMHSGQRPFPCNECGKRFSCKNHLKTHERTHSGERPFPCHQCGRKFIKQQHLVLHQVTHTGEKPFSCPVCGKGFTRQSSVVKHSAMHAEQKPFVCKECGKSYCQYANLVVHQRQHSGEKPFICKYCEKAFTCKATMLRHQRAHTGEKPFPCPHCDKWFIDHSTLSKHKRKIHAKEPKPA